MDGHKNKQIKWVENFVNEHKKPTDKLRINSLSCLQCFIYIMVRLLPVLVSNCLRGDEVAKANHLKSSKLTFLE